MTNEDKATLAAIIATLGLTAFIGYLMFLFGIANVIVYASLLFIGGAVAFAVLYIIFAAFYDFFLGFIKAYSYSRWIDDIKKKNQEGSKND